MAYDQSKYSQSGPQKQIGSRNVMTRNNYISTDNVGRNNQAHVYALSAQYDTQGKAIQIYTSMADNYKAKKAFALMMMSQCLNAEVMMVDNSTVSYPFGVVSDDLYNADSIVEEVKFDFTNINIEDFNPNKILNNESPILNIVPQNDDEYVTFNIFDAYSTASGPDGRSYTLPVSPMYFTWRALYDDAAEKEKSNRAEEITRKLSGITVLRNNYEAMVNYCRLMKLNVYEDKINSAYETTGLITGHGTTDSGDKYIKYTNLKTLITDLVIKTKSNLTSKTGYIISFNSAVLHSGWIQRDKETDPDWNTSPEQYEIKENDIETEKEMWDALGADIGYDTKLSDDDEPDTKRNYDYEKERIDTEIESYKFRNMSSLNNLFLGLAKYAEQQENLAETTDAKNMWKRIKADANIMYKKIQQADEQPKQ